MIQIIKFAKDNMISYSELRVEFVRVLYSPMEMGTFFLVFILIGSVFQIVMNIVLDIYDEWSKKKKESTEK